MKQMSRVCLVVLVLAPTLGFADGGLSVNVHKMSVTVESKALWVGDTTVFHTISWPDQPWIPRLEGAFEPVRVEKRGAAEYDWPDGGEIPFRTIVVVANPRTGDYGIGSPKDFPVGVGQIPLDAFVLNEKTRQVDVIALQGRRYEYMIVRPGIGAWRLLALDGSAADLDGVGNRQTLVALDSAQANERYGAPPASLVSGDLVIAIDCRSMGVLVGGV